MNQLTTILLAALMSLSGGCTVHVYGHADHGRQEVRRTNTTQRQAQRPRRVIRETSPRRRDTRPRQAQNQNQGQATYQTQNNRQIVTVERDGDTRPVVVVVRNEAPDASQDRPTKAKPNKGKSGNNGKSKAKNPSKKKGKSSSNGQAKKQDKPKKNNGNAKPGKKKRGNGLRGKFTGKGRGK